MALVAVYDASVLYPSTTRDLLIRIAHAGLVQAKWTEKILDEVLENLTKNRPDLDPARLARTRELMGGAVRDVLVVGYQPLVEALELPDPDDRHVLAAAIRSRAQLIVTNNLRDFPAETLRHWDVEAVSPDAFVRAQIDLDRLERDGLTETVAALRDQDADIDPDPPVAAGGDTDSER